jgi:hypothetical protein
MFVQPVSRLEHFLRRHSSGQVRAGQYSQCPLVFVAIVELKTDGRHLIENISRRLYEKITLLLSLAAWEASRNRDPPDIVMTAGLSADCAAPEFEAGHIECSLELMQRAPTEAADNVPFKAPYSADAFPGP